MRDDSDPQRAEEIRPSASPGKNIYGEGKRGEAGAGMLDVGQGLNQSQDVPAWGMGERGRGDPPTRDLLIRFTATRRNYLSFSGEVISSQQVFT